MQAASWRSSVAWLAVLVLVVRAQMHEQQQQQRFRHELPNANHIFNSVHSAMRQWGSSIRHNGMSFYLAAVPAGTQLYHGGHRDEPPSNPVWLAFEPEHALMFARPFVPLPNATHPPPPLHRVDGPLGAHPPPLGRQQALLPGRQSPPPGSHPPRPGLHPSVPVSPPASGQQVPLDEHDGRPRPPDHSRPGWLHTYATREDLRFLYVDGMSAAKSERGTLDSQDHVLLNGVELDGPIFGDVQRAKGLCSLIENEWPLQVAGIIRMEAGFEVIMCDLDQSTELIRRKKTAGVPEPNAGDTHSSFLFTYIRNIVARYGGIGGHRVTIDYGSLVTAYSFPLSMPVANNEQRLNKWPKHALLKLKADFIASVYHALGQGSSDETDWQAIADMVVLRYASWLPNLLMPEISRNGERLLEELQQMMQPFIDGDARSAMLETQRCSEQFLPTNRTHSLAAQAVTSISQLICETIAFAASDLERGLKSADEGESVRADVVGRIEKLVRYLQWTTWKDCKSCAYDEVCMTAIWPWGNETDHEQPSCTNASALMNRDDYWHSPELPDRKISSLVL